MIVRLLLPSLPLDRGYMSPRYKTMICEKASSPPACLSFYLMPCLLLVNIPVLERVYGDYLGMGNVRTYPTGTKKYNTYHVKIDLPRNGCQPPITVPNACVRWV
jgi:hypothetical protein